MNDPPRGTEKSFSSRLRLDKSILTNPRTLEYRFQIKNKVGGAGELPVDCAGHVQEGSEVLAQGLRPRLASSRTA